MNLDIEKQFGNQVIAGIDEAGRGALAGPVVAAAVIIDQNKILDGINDSKKLSAKQREYLYHNIINNYTWAVGIISPDQIDVINILQANIKACYAAVHALSVKIDIALVDGNMRFTDPRFHSIIKGDSKSLSIAAASIIAKVTRDKIMTMLATQYPQYGWCHNYGYGTKTHIRAIIEQGLSTHHRHSFHIKPNQKYLS